MKKRLAAAAANEIDHCFSLFELVRLTSNTYYLVTNKPKKSR